MFLESRKKANDACPSGMTAFCDCLFLPIGLHIGFNMRKEGIVNLINVIRILNYEFRFCLQIVQNYINMTSDAFR